MNNVSVIIVVVVSLVFLAGIFILLRELMCWYWKINKMIEEKTKTNILLSKILIQMGGTLETKPKSNIEVEDTSTHDYLDDQGKTRNVTAKTAEKAG